MAKLSSLTSADRLSVGAVPVHAVTQNPAARLVFLRLTDGGLWAADDDQEAPEPGESRIFSAFPTLGFPRRSSLTLTRHGSVPNPHPKPPIGLTPRHLSSSPALARCIEIAQASLRYAEAGLWTPMAWTSELLELLQGLPAAEPPPEAHPGQFVTDEPQPDPHSNPTPEPRPHRTPGALVRESLADLRFDLAESVRSAVKEFETETGMYVLNLDATLHRSATPGYPPGTLTSVALDVDVGPYLD